MKTDNQEDNMGCSIILMALVMGIIMFIIHLAFSLNRGEQYPIRSSFIETFSPFKNFGSEEHN